MPSARRCIKASKENNGKKCFLYKEMSRAVGANKPQEFQKAKALWKMKAARMQEKNTTTPRERHASKEEARQD